MTHKSFQLVLTNVVFEQTAKFNKMNHSSFARPVSFESLCQSERPPLALFAVVDSLG